MKLANIFTIKNQNLYANESMVMILAHLIDSYDPEYFKNSQWTIMDNGLYEGAQVSTSLRPLIEIAESSPININEIIIPDSFFDKDKTIQYFEENIPLIREWGNKYKFMFVAQAKDFNEFKEIMNYINQYTDLNLSVGIPKRAKFIRESDEAIAVYQKCNFPIHFLGLTDTTPIINLEKVKNIIRSCDTSQISTMIKNKGWDIFNWVRDENSQVIDLVNDEFEEDYLTEWQDKLHFWEVED